MLTAGELPSPNVPLVLVVKLAVPVCNTRLWSRRVASITYVYAFGVRMSFSCAGAQKARSLSLRGQRSRLPLTQLRSLRE